MKKTDTTATQETAETTPATAPANTVQLACKVLKPTKVGTHIKGIGARVVLSKAEAEELEKRECIEVLGLA